MQQNTYISKKRRWQTPTCSVKISSANAIPAQNAISSSIGDNQDLDSTDIKVFTCGIKACVYNSFLLFEL